VRKLLSFFAVYAFLHVLDERQHVAHPQDARSHALRVEWLECVQLLADAGEFDRLAGNVTHRQRRAAARVTIELRQNNTRERQRFGKRACSIHGILTLHRVDDEQRLDRRESLVKLANLAHHRLVDCKTSRGVDDQDVVVVASRVIERTRRDVEGPLAAR
jgi:hypothetical protein